MSELWTTITERVPQEHRKEFNRLKPIVDIAASSNPRAAIRFVNNLLIDRGIYDAIQNGVEGESEVLPVQFFAVSRSLQQRWSEIYLLISRATSTHCELLQKHLTKTLSAEETESNSKFLSEADSFSVELCELLCTDFCQQWLIDHEKRRKTIDFLDRNRNILGRSFEEKTGVFYRCFHEPRYSQKDLGPSLCET